MIVVKPFGGQPSGESLGTAFVRSVRANVFAEVFTQGVRVGGFVFLAHTLLPSDFGILRVLITATLLAGLLPGAGIPDALIQRDEITGIHESTAWWITLILSCWSAGLLYLGAGQIARTMAMPSLRGALSFLSIPLIIDGTSSVANARLRRGLRFAALARADFLGELAFVACALVTLWLGLPRWSLVAALAGRLTCHGLVVWCSEPYLPRTVPRVAAAKDLLRFSASVWGGRILGVMSGNADYLLIGRMLGSQTLGYYVIAWDLLRFIPDRLYYVAGRVTLPAFCRLQHDNRALTRAYLEFTGYLARMILPIMLCVAVAAPYVVTGLYGQQWRLAAEPLRILTFGLSLTGLRLAIGSVYYTKDHPAFDIYLHGARLLLIIVAVELSVPFGLLGVSMAMSAVEALISIVGQVLAGSLIDLPLGKWFGACGDGAKLATACGVAALFGTGCTHVLHLEGVVALVVIALPCAVVFAWVGMDNALALLRGGIPLEPVR